MWARQAANLPIPVGMSSSWTGLDSQSPGQIGRSATLEVPLWTVQTINQQVKHHLNLPTCLTKLQTTLDILLELNNLQYVCKQSPKLMSLANILSIS